VIKHHLNPERALDNYDFSQISPNIQTVNMLQNTQHALDQLAANRTAEIFSLQDVLLTDTQINDLAEFLQALTDPCVENRECLSKWIPDASDANPDELRINAIDENGKFL
jgi:cytochrome c peroxidase